MRLAVMPYWETLREAWRQRDSLGDRNLAQEERNFLPAALELQETPPSPAGRILAWALMALFSIGVLWAAFGHVDIVAVAEGKIIPTGHSKQIQPLEKGVVKVIHVVDGQAVEKGDPLIELDQTLTAADQERATRELEYVGRNIIRQRAFLKLLEYPEQNLTLQKVMRTLPRHEDDTTGQQDLLWQQWRSYLARRETLQAQLAEKQAEKKASHEIIKQLEATVPLVTRRAQTLKTLADKNLAPEMQYLELEEQRINQSQMLAAEHSRQEQFSAAIVSIEKQLQSLDADIRAQTMTEIQESERQQQAIIQELNKAKDLNAKQILYAPVAGEVQQLAMHTIGGVVTPAQPLMVIVPKTQKLEVEAVIENKDIGFVHEGQKAEVKIHTFPFTRYGVIDAEVVGITEDAIADEQRGLIYKMRLKLEKSTLWVDEKEIDLLPGMAVSAEVKTGKRRLIEYFLAPLLRYGSESVRER